MRLGPLAVRENLATIVEVFAPIVNLYRYRDFSAVLDAVNDSAFGLQAGVESIELDVSVVASIVLARGSKSSAFVTWVQFAAEGGQFTGDDFLRHRDDFHR